MPTKLGEEDLLRKKVWKIINLIQANQLFVHSQHLTIQFLDGKNKVQTKTFQTPALYGTGRSLVVSPNLICESSYLSTTIKSSSMHHYL